MDLNDTPEQADYRAQVRAWLEEHRGEAPVLRGEGALKDEDEIVAARREWQRKLAEAGLAGDHVAEGVRRSGPRARSSR